MTFLLKEGKRECVEHTQSQPCKDGGGNWNTAPTIQGQLELPEAADQATLTAEFSDRPNPNNTLISDFRDARDYFYGFINTNNSIF